MPENYVAVRCARCRWSLTAIAGMLACLLTVSGCFVPIPFVWPAISSVPGKSVGVDDKGIYAFRMDIRRQEGSPCFTTFGVRCKMRQIRLKKNGRIPQQTQVSLTSGVIWHCVALDHTHYDKSYLLVRVYRRGYATVELEGETKRPIEWQKALTLWEQEKAVDDLFRAKGTECERLYDRIGPEWSSKYHSERVQYDKVSQSEFWEASFCCLASGSVSKAHREVLLFGANEYERIAGTVKRGVSSLSGLRSRCTEKARWFRELADK